MRLIVIVISVSLMALTFAATPSQADSVSGAVTEVGASCFDYDLTVENDKKGAAISSVLAFVTWTPDGSTPECPTEPPSEAPTGWSRQFLDEGAGSLLVKWEADSGKSSLKSGSLSGFIVRVEACPVSVDLWTTFKKNGVQTATGSFVIPCP